MCVDGTIKVNPISLCSHPATHHNINREARHSPTWHSSESESARGRFEPVAVVKQLSDGRGTLFVLVAARRQKEFKRGILSSFCPFRSFRTSEKNSKTLFTIFQKIPHQQKNTPFPRLGKARHNACLSRDMLKLNLHLTLGTQYRMSGCRPPVIFLLLTRL